MTRLFDDNDKWTNLANKYANEVEIALRPIVNKAGANNVSLRDVQYVIEATSVELTLCAIIDKHKTC